MPIGAIDNPHFEDFTNPKEAPAAKTHGLIGLIHKIRQASPNADFSNKLNTTLNMMVRGAKSEEFFSARTVFFLSANRKAKGGGEWLGSGIIIGRFWDKYALVHSSGSYLEVDIGDMRSANRLWGIIGRDGALQLHVPSTEFPIHYPVIPKH